MGLFSESTSTSRISRPGWGVYKDVPLKVLVCPQEYAPTLLDGAPGRVRLSEHPDVFPARDLPFDLDPLARRYRPFQGVGIGVGAILTAPPGMSPETPSWRRIRAKPANVCGGRRLQQDSCIAANRETAGRSWCCCLRVLRPWMAKRENAAG
jgi:hypothetical protein